MLPLLDDDEPLLDEEDVDPDDELDELDELDGPLDDEELKPPEEELLLPPVLLDELEDLLPEELPLEEDVWLPPPSPPPQALNVRISTDTDRTCKATAAPAVIGPRAAEGLVLLKVFPADSERLLCDALKETNYGLVKPTNTFCGWQILSI